MDFTSDETKGYVSFLLSLAKEGVMTFRYPQHEILIEFEALCKLFNQYKSCTSKEALREKRAVEDDIDLLHDELIEAGWEDEAKDLRSIYCA